MNVYLMCGLAFSGKSTIASAIQRLRGAAVIRLDDLNAARGLRGGLGIAAEEWGRSHREAMARLEEALRAGRDVVVDDTNCFRFLRDGYRAVADRFGAETRILYLDAPLELVRRRMRGNEHEPSRHPVTEPVLLDLIRKFQPPAGDEPVLRVPPDCDAEEWVARHLPVASGGAT